MPPVPLYVSRGYLLMLWAWGESIHPMCLGSQGGISTSVRHFGVSVHPLFLSLQIASYWTGYLWVDVCYASCCCTFLCSFIMSQISTTMAMTTTPAVTVMSSGMSSLSSVTMAPFMMGLPAILGQQDVVLLPSLTPRCPGGVIGLATVPQLQPPSLMPLQAYANYAMGSPQVGFFFIVKPPTILYIICLVPLLVIIFYFQVPCWMPYSPLGHNHWGLCHCNPLSLPMAGKCVTWWWSSAQTRYAQCGCSLHYLE